MLLFFSTVLPKAVVMALCTVRGQADGCSEVPVGFLHESKLRMNVYKELWDSWHWKLCCKQKRLLWCCHFFLIYSLPQFLVWVCCVTRINTFSFTNEATGSQQIAWKKRVKARCQIIQFCSTDLSLQSQGRIPLVWELRVCSSADGTVFDENALPLLRIICFNRL